MDQFIFFLNKVMVPGLVTGSVYALGAIGVTLIFGILRFAHFAHGDMMTAGSYFAWVMATALAFCVAMVPKGPPGGGTPQSCSSPVVPL